MTLHLPPDEVDAYWTGRLSADRVRPFEEHFLGCAACRAEVARVEELRAALQDTAPASTQARSHRSWLAVAALLAAVVGGLLIENWRLRQRVPQRDEGASAREWQKVELEPALRGSRIRELRLAPGVRHVLLKVDAREAGAPGTRFDVSVLDAGKNAVLRVAGIASEPDGSVAIAVPAALLSGDHVVELRGGGELTEIPFRVGR